MLQMTENLSQLGLGKKENLLAHDPGIVLVPGEAIPRALNT